MVSEALRENVRRVLAEELDSNALRNMVIGIIDDYQCLKTAVYRDDTRTIGDMMESLDQRTRILRGKLDQANDV
jgi:hypothetical protein